MKQLIEDIAKALVDIPEEVAVREVQGEQVTVLELKVAPSDLGKVTSFEGMVSRIMRNFTGIRVPKGEGLQGLNVAITLTPGEAARGGILSMGVPVFYRCPFYAGRGRQWLFPCMGCEGQGMVEEEERLVFEGSPHSQRGVCPGGAPSSHGHP